MSQWLDEKYISIVGMQLNHFHKQSRTTYSFRCPICGDSKKRSNRTRGYFFLHQQKYFYKCHNCNVGMSLRSFLRQQAPELYREYQMDVLRQERPVMDSTPEEEEIIPEAPPVTLPTIASLPDDHIAKQYCLGRMLPDIALEHLHFTDEWTEWIKELGWSYALPEDNAPRLILPWYHRNGNLLGAQARRIDVSGKEGRYVTLKYEQTQDKVYGWDRLDFAQRIYVVEGPLDSWFLPNAIASMDSDLIRMHDKYVGNYAAVYVWDNEPRNEQVVKSLRHAIKCNLPVVIWPQSLAEKDLNEMHCAGHNVLDIVKAHTYRGVRAELEFSRWSLLK